MCLSYDYIQPLLAFQRPRDSRYQPQYSLGRGNRLGSKSREYCKKRGVSLGGNGDLDLWIVVVTSIWSLLRLCFVHLAFDDAVQGFF